MKISGQVFLPSERVILILFRIKKSFSPYPSSFGSCDSPTNWKTGGFLLVKIMKWYLRLCKWDFWVWKWAFLVWKDDFLIWKLNFGYGNETFGYENKPLTEKMRLLVMKMRRLAMKMEIWIWKSTLCKLKLGLNFFWF